MDAPSATAFQKMQALSGTPFGTCGPTIAIGRKKSGSDVPGMADLIRLGQYDLVDHGVRGFVVWLVATWPRSMVEAYVFWRGRGRPDDRLDDPVPGRPRAVRRKGRAARAVHRRRRLVAVGTVGVLVAAAALAGCGSDSGKPVLTWYINPDDGGQADLAAKCSAASGGRYAIKTSLLPRDASQQREQLVRRLAAEDESISMISLDPPFVPEFAQAGFLKTVPQGMRAEVTDDVVQSAINGSTWKDKLVAAPFWANTQLLWYRKSLAKKAGLDMSKPVTWDQLIEAAEKLDTNLGVQGVRAESLTVWINALVASGGGKILANPEAEADKVKLTLDSKAGRKAAQIVSDIGKKGLGGPALSTANEDAGAAMFENGDALAMVNWPFVYARAKDNAASEDEDGKPKKPSMDPKVFADYGWAQYPATEPGRPSKPPYGGINIGVGAFTPHPDEAFDAVRCIVSADNQAEYMKTNGNPAAKKSVYDRADVREQYPSADVIRASLDAAQPRPLTPYYNEVSAGIQRTWHPPDALNPDQAPAAADDLITKVLRKEELL